MTFARKRIEGLEICPVFADPIVNFCGVGRGEELGAQN